MSADAPSVSTPTLVLIGRQNVGKSTLFNRLCRTRRAIVSDVAGTTRDWLEGTSTWDKRAFRVIDTGGYAAGEDDVLSAVRKQVEDWAKRADAVLWIADGKQGLTGADREIGRWLRRLSRHVLVVVNKLDHPKNDALMAEFHAMGFPHVFGVSAAHGRGVGDLLSEIAKILNTPESGAAAPSIAQARVAIVGRPNVGKSSLFNRITGEERAIVSDIPGTTRDALDTALTFEEKNYLFLDTAGLRSKKSKSTTGLEGLSRIMAEKALERSEVALLLLDARDGLVDGDTAVGRLIQAKNRACVVGVNKWDLVEDRAHFLAWYKERQPADMPFLTWAPIVFLSAKTGYHVAELLGTIWKTHEQYHRTFDDGDLEAFFWSQVQERPYSFKGKKLVFKGARQIGKAPPTIRFSSNLLPEEVHFSYQRRLENLVRERYGVLGSPLILDFRKE